MIAVYITIVGVMSTYFALLTAAALWAGIREGIEYAQLALSKDEDFARSERIGMLVTVIPMVVVGTVLMLLVYVIYTGPVLSAIFSPIRRKLFGPRLKRSLIRDLGGDKNCTLICDGRSWRFMDGKWRVEPKTKGTVKMRTSVMPDGTLWHTKTRTLLDDTEVTEGWRTTNDANNSRIDRPLTEEEKAFLEDLENEYLSSMGKKLGLAGL